MKKIQNVFCFQGTSQEEKEKSFLICFTSKESFLTTSQSGRIVIKVSTVVEVCTNQKLIYNLYPFQIRTVSLGSLEFLRVSQSFSKFLRAPQCFLVFLSVLFFNPMQLCNSGNANCSREQQKEEKECNLLLDPPKNLLTGTDITESLRCLQN